MTKSMLRSGSCKYHFHYDIRATTEETQATAEPTWGGGAAKRLWVLDRLQSLFPYLGAFFAVTEWAVYFTCLTSAQGSETGITAVK